MPARLFNSLALGVLFLLLANCAAPRTAPVASAPSSSQRSQSLATMGYKPLPLLKTPGDTRYSGKFLVNGQQVQLLIDSGANSTDLNARVSTKLGLETKDSIEVVSRGALGRPVTAQVGLGSLTAGGLTAAPFPFMVAQHPEGRHTATSRYDGQLGLDALSGLGVLVDLADGHMWIPGANAPLNRRGLIRPLGKRKGLAFDALPLKRTGRLPHLHVRSKWGAQELTWVVDTGAEVTVLAKETADKLNIATRPSRSRIIDASGDEAQASVAVLDQVIFNRLVVQKFQVAVVPLAEVRRSFKDSRGRPIDGIIGMDFLEESAALLDSSSKLLYIGRPDFGQLGQPLN